MLTVDYIGPDKELQCFSYQSVETSYYSYGRGHFSNNIDAYADNGIKSVLGAQKNRLIETVILSIHNIC